MGGNGKCKKNKAEFISNVVVAIVNANYDFSELSIRNQNKFKVRKQGQVHCR